MLSFAAVGSIARRNYFSAATPRNAIARISTLDNSADDDDDVNNNNNIINNNNNNNINVNNIDIDIDNNTCCGGDVLG